MACKGLAVMKLLQGTDLKELNHALRTYLAPLFGNSGSGKEKNANSEQRVLAKEYVPFLVQLLKVCGAKLASVPSREDKSAIRMADELFSAMVQAIDGLDVLRSQLTGSPFEMELQRYGLVRRLMNWKRYGAALSQSQLLFRSLCLLSSIPGSKWSSVNQAKSERICKAGVDNVKVSAGRFSPYDDSVLCPPREVDSASELPVVLVAAVIDLIWCIAESSEDSSSCFQLAARLPQLLAPWISLLDPGTATKQRDALFRAIHKCSLIMLADVIKFEAALVEQFCMLTLSLCASSTQCDQYAKVARKLCSSLSCQGSDWCIKALEICTGAFGEVLSHSELGRIWNSYEFADLVEWFARSCQSNNQIEYGWFQIYKLVIGIMQVSPGAPVVIMGLCGVGLVLMPAEPYQTNAETLVKQGKGDGHELPDLNKLGFLLKGRDYSNEACILIHGAEEVLKLLLERGQSPSAGNATESTSKIVGGHARFDSSSKSELLEINGKTFVSAARAFHYVQKSFTKFVQTVWNAYSARSSEKELPNSLFNSALGKVLLLFYPVIEMGMRRSDLSDTEKDIFRKGFQMASQASLAALRASLLLQNGVQESFDLIRDMTFHLQPEEQWWLMSSTYNMGVQLFNIKQYSLACWPLDLAHKAAWARAKSSCSDVKSEASVNEMVTEACAKCLAHVDAQHRNGEPGKSIATLTDGLMQWAKVRAEMHPRTIKLPHSIVRLFVKLICVENELLTQNKAEGELCSMYNIILDIQPPLPAGITGLLLEEEHAVCEAMEDQYPDTCHALIEQIMKCLLDKLYTGGQFALERSRVLMKKCRHSRMHGAENLPSCIKFISEAVSLLETALERRGKSSGDLWETPGLEKQLAVAYSIMGICSYERNPCCQEFLPKIVLSLNMWRRVLRSHTTGGGLCESDISSTAALYDEEPLVLLLYISDLLAVQGYSVLSSEAQEVILKVISHSKQSSAEKEWVQFWMNGQLGHLQCAVPFPVAFLSNIQQSFDVTGNPQEYWEKYFNLFPGSLLEAHHHSVQDTPDLTGGVSESSRSKLETCERVKLINSMVHARLSDGRKSSLFSLQTAGLHHLTSELAFAQGDTHEAIRYAKEALRLRSRLFKFVFSGLGKRGSGVSSDATSNPSACGNSKILQLREHLGPLATSSWPYSVTAQHCLSHPSQWKILGDYIESLMQVGVVYERMGAVEEAERSFREGHRLALAQNLPLALAAFSMNLGEVYRKRQLWETAESYFIQAKQVFENLQTQRTCESCILIGKAMLELRIGDLVRHWWYSQQEIRKDHCSHSNIIEHCFENYPTDALSSYEAAAASLSLLLKEGCEICDIGNRGLLHSHETQITMLRSLQRKGKNVSLEIMSHNLEETGASGSRTRKSRLRKSVQSRSSGLLKSEAGSVGMERNISALCDNMRLTSLTSDMGARPEVQNRRSISEQVDAADELVDTSTAKQKYVVVKKELELGPDVKTKESISSVTKAHGGFHPLGSGVLRSSFSIEKLPDCKWTQIGRRLMSKVLLQRGKCYIHLGQLDEAAGIFQQAMSILDISSLAQPDNTEGKRSLFPVEEGALLYHLSRLSLQRGQHGFASRNCEQLTRRNSDDLEIGKAQSMHGLYRAFSLCGQVPLLLQKIAKLLAILHASPGWGATSQGNFFVQGMAEVAAYFHQASLGTAIRQQHLAVLDSKLDDPPLEDNQQLNPCLANDCMEKMQSALRFPSVNVRNVGLQARDFWERLPCSSACCISFVSMEDVNLLKGNCFPSVADSDAVTDWLLVTRSSVKSKPVVVLLPVVPLLENLPLAVSASKPGECSSTPYDLSDDEDDDGHKPSEEQNCQVNKSTQTVIQRVVAEFGSVLDESRLSTSGTHPVATLEEKSVWWKWRMELDARLSVLLKMLESSWFGPFKCLLLGEPQQESMTQAFELCTVYLLDMISSIVSQETCRTIDHSFVKILLQSVGSLAASELERIIADILGFHNYHCCETHPNKYATDCNGCRWKKAEAGKYEQIMKVSNSFCAAYAVSTQGCEIDKLKCFTDENNGKRRSKRQAKGKTGPKNQSPLDIIIQMASDGSYCPDAPLKRRPLQLILDSDSQVLPWESLPILRDHEVYRMPSLGTICAIYIQRDSIPKTREIQQAERQKVEEKVVKVGRRSSVVPAAMEMESDKHVDVTYVNPYNTYYILNPNGDLLSTQAAFEDWFTHQLGWKGKAGIVPTAEEYQMGLQNHDLFVYLGHGSGDQFLPERYVRQLDHCAASLLMGCSSGRLFLRGEYQPVGVVLSYLMAGCPAVIANLWDVTDGDIDRFSRFLLHSWLGSKPESAHFDLGKGLRDMSDYEQAMEEGQHFDAVCQARYAGKSNSRLVEKHDICQAAFEDMHRLGSAIGQSRNACRLPHLIGASPVCYGIPTGVKQIYAYSTS